MIFKELEIKSLSSVPHYITNDKPFPYGFVYPSGWFEGGTVFEVQFPHIPQDLANAFGYIEMTGAQFMVSQSTLTAVVYFKDFKAKLLVDTFYYQIATAPDGEAYYGKDGSLLFLTKKGTDYFKKLLRVNTDIYVSPGTYENHDELSIEGSVSLARDFLINFWVNKPGVTDGPANGSSDEEIRAFLEKRTTDILPTNLR